MKSKTHNKIREELLYSFNKSWWYWNLYSGDLFGSIYIDSTSNQMTAQQARKIFRKDSGMQTFARRYGALKKDPTNNSKMESLAKFVDERFISNRNMNALNDPDLQVSNASYSKYLITYNL